MITYNAKDLIEQAQMIADLQNSDFISWKENVMFLDNAWADLYQQIINHGDKAFLESFNFSGDRCELPCDFYQLYYICYYDGCFKRPINRKSKTSTNEGPYYDIVGNEIIIYNKTNSLKNIEVSYFPVRDTITYAADDVKIELVDNNYNRDVLDVCDKKILVYDNDTLIRFERDIINNKETRVSNKSFMLTESGVIDESESPRFKSDNKAYYSYYKDGVVIFNKIESGKEIHRVKVSENPNFPANQINALTDTAVYYYKDGVLKRFDLETGMIEDYADGLTNSKIYSFNNDIYYETTDGIWCNNKLLIPTLCYNRFQGVMKVDKKTGYGILVDNYVIKSAFENTELLFPSNVYYNYMAYKLATYYKIKQGADASSIAALAADALNTFYNTLPRDENEYVRISNVYAK